MCVCSLVCLRVWLSLHACACWLGCVCDVAGRRVVQPSACLAVCVRLSACPCECLCVYVRTVVCVCEVGDVCERVCLVVCLYG